MLTDSTYFGSRSPFSVPVDAVQEVVREGDLVAVSKIKHGKVILEVGAGVKTPDGEAALLEIDVHIHSEVKRVELICTLLDRDTALVVYVASKVQPLLSARQTELKDKLLQACVNCTALLQARNTSRSAHTVYHARLKPETSAPAIPALRPTGSKASKASAASVLAVESPPSLADSQGARQHHLRAVAVGLDSVRTSAASSCGALAASSLEICSQVAPTLQVSVCFFVAF
jgi:hypothetical protein